MTNFERPCRHQTAATRAVAGSDRQQSMKQPVIERRRRQPWLEYVKDCTVAERFVGRTQARREGFEIALFSLVAKLASRAGHIVRLAAANLAFPPTGK